MSDLEKKAKLLGGSTAGLGAAAKKNIERAPLTPTEQVQLQPEKVDLSVRVRPALKLKDTVKGFRSFLDRKIGSAASTRDFGGRTFPTATMIGGTPMTPTAEKVHQDVRSEAEASLIPFFMKDGVRYAKPMWESVSAEEVKGRVPDDLGVFGAKGPEKMLHEQRRLLVHLREAEKKDQKRTLMQSLFDALVN